MQTGRHAAPRHSADSASTPGLGRPGRAGPLPSPFMRSWWVDNAARRRPGDPACASTTTATLVGGAAFEVDRSGRARGRGASGSAASARDHWPPTTSTWSPPATAPGGARQRSAAGFATGRPDDRPRRTQRALRAAVPAGRTGDRPRARAVRRALRRRTPSTALPGRLRSTVKRSRQAARQGRLRDPALVPPPRTPAAALDTLLRAPRRPRGSEDSGFADGVGCRFRAAAAAGMAAGEVVIHELADGEARDRHRAGDGGRRPRVAFYQAGRLTDHEYRGSGSVLKAAVLRWARGAGMRRVRPAAGRRALQARVGDRHPPRGAGPHRRRAAGSRRRRGRQPLDAARPPACSVPWTARGRGDAGPPEG